MLRTENSVFKIELCIAFCRKEFECVVDYTEYIIEYEGIQLFYSNMCFLFQNVE